MAQTDFESFDRFEKAGDILPFHARRGMMIRHTFGDSMSQAKIAVSIDRDLLAKLDDLVKEDRFPNRSRAVQEAVRDKLDLIERERYARECAKLDPAEEQSIADEGLAEDFKEWPDY
jgi:Arc/MetJ-type ribon-helix-helix transcriptional regulator